MDLGFRLADIGGLEREPVSYGRTDPQHNLSYNGATEEEIAILVNRASGRAYSSERVELNAMMANEFVGWIDRKLQAAGVTKLIPEDDVLASARPPVPQAPGRRRSCADLTEQTWTAPDDLAARVNAPCGASGDELGRLSGPWWRRSRRATATRPQREAITMSKDKTGCPTMQPRTAPDQRKPEDELFLFVLRYCERERGRVKPPACVRGGMKRISLMPLRLREVV